jgi:hypothetical protein
VRRHLLFTALLVTSAGCTLLSGVADLEATREVTSTPDGSIVVVPPGVDGTASIPVEASAKDVIAPPVDAGSDVVVTNQNFCDGLSAAVCFDYDSKSIDPALPQVRSNATLTVDAPGRDSNKALHCVGHDDLAVQCFHTAPLPASPKKIHYRFDALVESPGLSIEMNEIELSYAVGSCALQPTIVGTDVQINEYCPNQGAPDQVNHSVATLDSIDPQAWYTFDITLDLAGRTLSGTFTKPGTSTKFGPITLDPRFLTSPKVALHAGLSYSPKNTPAARLRTDNVSLDLP